MILDPAKHIQATKDAEKAAKAARGKAARAFHKTLNVQLAGSGDTGATTTGPSQVPMRTTSGGSLESLSKYSLDYNLAETCEVSSSLNIPEYPPPVNPTAAELVPDSPMTVGQRLYEVKAAMLWVDDSV